MLLFKHGVRRKLAAAGAAATLIAAGALTAGCGGGSDSSSSATSGHKPVTISLGWFWDGKTGAPKALLDGFHKKYPWITVKEQSTPYNGYYNKLGAWTSSNSGPDAIFLESGSLAAPYLRDMRPLDKAAFQPQLDAATDPTVFCRDYDCNKGVYSVGFGNQGYPVYYSKAILREAGLDPENPPRTFGEMTAACNAVKRIGKQCLGILGKGFGLPIMIGDMGLRVATKQQMLDLGSGKAKWTDPEFKQLLMLIQYIGRNGWYQDGWASATDNATAFLGGKTAFIVGFLGGDGANAAWSNLTTLLGPDAFGVMQLPKVAPGDVPGVTPGPLNDSAGVTEGQAIVIPKWSKHPREAELLLRETLDPAVQREMANQSRAAILPSLKAARADWVPAPAFARVLAIAQQSRSADMLTYMGYGYLPTVIAQLQNLTAGKTTVDAAAAALEKAAEAARNR